MKITGLLIWLLAGVPIVPAFGQTRSLQPSGAVLDVGIRLQQSINLYAENGITAHYTNPKLAHQRLYVGFSYVTSRLGSALGSNAIKQDNVLLSASYYFWMKRQIRPVIKANVGYFAASYGAEVFSELPNTSLLASPEVGFAYCPAFPLKINASVGFNLLTGNGMTGPGTLYPVFVQTSITWNLLNN
ncbi:hypothetical protein [Fibrivirga algicola]|uniref:hypothetical protein n=1 Tax=Fibrivirga algicola TaxID=2950420 RepID=UPI0014196C7A|nr:hypothetical protein [Fibrivirga algicola]